MNMLDNIGGRKLVAVLICTVVAVVMVLVKGDVPSNMLSLLEVLFGGFVAGNVTEHISAVIKAKGEAAGTAVVPAETDLTEVHNRLTNLEQTNVKIGESVAISNQLLQFIAQKAGLGRPQS